MSIEFPTAFPSRLLTIQFLVVVRGQVYNFFIGSKNVYKELIILYPAISGFIYRSIKYV